jgi:methyl-accepting chemotaxis protein
MKSLSLGYKILLPILVLVVFGMGITSYISARRTSNIIHEMVISQLETLTGNLTKQVSSWIKDLRIDLSIQAQTEVYQTCLLMDDADDNDIYVTQANDKLKEFSDRYGIYNPVFLVNKKGSVIASTAINEIGKTTLADRDYFKQAILGQANISKILQSKSSGHAVFVVAVPVKVYGKVDGAIIGVIEVAKFSQEFILPIKIGSQGFAYMVDRSGLVSAHPDKKNIFKTNLNDYDWGKKIMSGKNGILTYIFKGEEKLVSFSTDPLTGWTIIAGAATSDIFSAGNKLMIVNVIISAIILIIITVVIFFIVKPIIAALVKGIEFAKEIQLGDTSKRLSLNRSDEIGQLATALDSMVDSLQQRAELAEAIAAGDLTHDIPLASDKDALGESLLNMTAHLNEILSQVNNISEQLDSGSDQVSDSAQSLSQGATEQAAAIEEIGASLHELSGSTRDNANMADTASQLAGSARTAADEGRQQMQQMVIAMHEINESGHNISKIIKTIDEIAFQTNLLALNAAVEAARAGQHGKGFAVVAEEVRNLAARSAKAAGETAELIEGTVNKGKNGTDIANRTAAALEAIVSEIGKTADLIGEITISSKEQAEGISQVVEGLDQVSHVTQQNTAEAEESAAASEELSSQSANLSQLLLQFKLRKSVSKSVGQNPVPQLALANSDSDMKTLTQETENREKSYGQTKEFSL